MPTTTPNRRVIVVSVPDATVQLLELIADARNIELGEMASILLQQAVLDTAAWDRRQNRSAA